MGLVSPRHVWSSRIRDRTHVSSWQEDFLLLSHQGSPPKSYQNDISYFNHFQKTWREFFFFFSSNHTILKIVTCHCFYLLCFGAMEITCMALSFIFFMNKVDSVTIALPTFSWFRWSKYLIAAFLTDSLSSWLNIQILIQITTPYYDRQYVVIH